MKIISRRRKVENFDYSLHFDFEDCCGGYAFDCDENGFLIGRSSYSDENSRNLIDCLLGNNNTVYKGIVSYYNSYTEPAIGLCDCCGGEVLLEGFTNTCSCGADYNSSGQILADRSFWGEETGECLSDILGV